MCSHGIHHLSLEPTQTCAQELPYQAHPCKWCNPISWRCQNKSDENAFIRSWIVFIQFSFSGCVGAAGWLERRSHLSNWHCIRRRWGANKVAGIRWTHRELYMTDWVTKLCSSTLMFMLMEISSSRAVAFEALCNKFCVCFGLMVSLIGRIWWRLEVLIIKKV